MVCIDPTKTGDISTELAVDEHGKPLPHRRVLAVDATQGEKAISNPNSGLVWEFVAEPTEGERELDIAQQMHRCAASVAVHDGLAIAADSLGVVHCLDAKSVEHYWGYDMFAGITSAPLVVGDRVYVADEEGDVAIFGLSADPGVAMRRTEDGEEPLVENTVGNRLPRDRRRSHPHARLPGRTGVRGRAGRKDGETPLGDANRTGGRREPRHAVACLTVAHD